MALLIFDTAALNNSTEKQTIHVGFFNQEIRRYPLFLISFPV